MNTYRVFGQIYNPLHDEKPQLKLAKAFPDVWTAITTGIKLSKLDKDKQVQSFGNTSVVVLEHYICIYTEGKNVLTIGGE